MKYAIIKYLLVLCFPIVAAAQKIDSLQHIIHSKEIADSIKVSAYIKLSEIYYSKDLDSMEMYCLQGIQTIDSSITKENLTSLHAELFNNLGMAHYRKSELDKAVNAWYSALKLKEINKDLKGQANVLNNIGNIQLDLNENNKATTSFNKVLKIQESINDSAGVARTYNTLGYIKRVAGNDSLALNYYQKALKIRISLNNKFGIASSRNNIGFIYKKNKSYTNAINQYNAALEIFTELDDKKGLASVYNNLANCYYELKQYRKAERMANKGLNIAEKLKAKEELLFLNEVLYKIHKELNNYKQAFQFQENYWNLKDTIESEENYKALINQETKYEYEKKEKIKEIEFQKEQEMTKLRHETAMQLEGEKQKRLQTIILTSAISILVILILLYLIAKQLKLTRNQKSIIEEQKHVIEQKALRLQMNPHFLFNSLNSIKYFVVNHKADESSEYLSKFSVLMRQVLENSNKTLITLKEELDCLSNYLALEQLRSGNKFSYQIKNCDVAEIAKIPPMLLQPFVENAVIHGINPKQTNDGLISIDCIEEENGVRIEIIDNGIGLKASKKLNKTKIDLKTSLGLLISDNRIKNLFAIESEQSTIETKELFNDQNEVIGTKVIILIPYYE